MMMLRCLRSSRVISRRCSSTSTPMMDQYWKCKRQYPEYLMFFQVGDFYELFYQDADRAAELLGLAKVQKGGKIPMCGVPIHSIDRFLQRLVMHHGVSVSICDQVETVAQAKHRGNKSIVNREVVRLVTPGTLTEDSLLNPTSNNYLASLYLLDHETIGLALTDISTGVWVSTNSSVDTIEGDLARYNPSELIVPSVENHLLNGIIKYKVPKNCTVTLRPNAAFEKATDAATTASNGLLEYLRYTQKTTDLQLKPQINLQHSMRLQIDASAWKSLELSHTLIGKSMGSLLHAIDRTKTAAGSRLLADHLSAPSCDLNEIRLRQKAVKYFRDDELARKSIQTSLKACSDLERNTQRVLLGRGSPKDMRAICDTLIHAETIVAFLQDAPGTVYPELLIQLTKKMVDNASLLHLITQQLDKALHDDVAMSNVRTGFVREGYSSELDDLQQTLSLARGDDKELLKRYESISGVKKLRLKQHTKMGFFVEVPKAEQTKLLAEDGFSYAGSTKTHARFKTPELTAVDKRIWSAGARIAIVEQQIFQELMQLIHENSIVIQTASDFLAMIDIICSHAETAQQKIFVCPIVDHTCELHIHEGRHAVVEAALERNNGSRVARHFVPNNLHLSNDLGTSILLTGANMGGKSTYLRQNAHIVILAQMGSFVPATFARVGIVDQLFSRVGASDDLGSDRSTFMVEMEETAAILNKATNRSVVLMDEVGRGTSIHEGFAIARAVLEAICQRQTRTLFATHFHQLGMVNETLPGLKNHQMEIIESSRSGIIFAHRVISGVAEHSYGLHIARIAGCPSNVLERARDLLQEQQSDRINDEIKQLDMETLSPETALNLITRWHQSLH